MRTIRLPHRPAAVVATVVAGLVLAACGAEATDTSPTSGATSAAAAAPEFTLQTLDGAAFKLADHHGDVVVVEFLAPGCPSCAADLATLTEASEEMPDVTFLVADVSGAGPDDVRAFYRDENDVPPEVLIAPDREFAVSQAYQVTALGDTAVIAPDGTLSWMGRWAGDESKLFAQIREASAS